MKLLRLFALLTPIALAAPISAQAAMNTGTRATFINDCQAAAVKNPSVDQTAAKSLCECGAQQVDKNFSDKEIGELSSKTSPPSAQLSAKLQKVVTEHCIQPKKSGS